VSEPATTVESSREPAIDESRRELERRLRSQRSLAWLLSVSTLVITIAFFVMMTSAASLLSRVALGRSITLATVLAAAVIVFYLCAITLFARHADRTDAQMRLVRGQQ
jgi:uncharacterized membrane protein (DUF485 family)